MHHDMPMLDECLQESDGRDSDVNFEENRTASHKHRTKVWDVMPDRARVKLQT